MRFSSMSSRLAAIAVVILVPGAMLSASSPARAASSPARAAAASVSPTLTVSTNLANRRYVAAGDRAYELGTEDGRYPAMGFHTRGEMGGIWTPPIKLLDGIWFGINGTWIGPATSFTSGFGHVQMTLPQTTTGPANNLQITRTDFVPDGRRAVEIGLTFTASNSAPFTLMVDAHSELMSAYPWGFTTPDQTQFNLPDTASFTGSQLVFQENGTPPVANATPHSWAAVVGATGLTPATGQTGSAFPARRTLRSSAPLDHSPTFIDAMTLPTARARAASLPTTFSCTPRPLRRSGSRLPARIRGWRRLRRNSPRLARTRTASLTPNSPRAGRWTARPRCHCQAIRCLPMRSPGANRTWLTSPSRPTTC